MRGEAEQGQAASDAGHLATTGTATDAGDEGPRSAPLVAPGDMIAAKYRVDRVLGAGGMGVVVAATHVELFETRAIKLLRSRHKGDAEAAERFLREARAASRLKSEHVARVYDVGRLDDGAPYMVMEYLEGEDLGRKVERGGPLPPAEAVSHVLQACEALAEAHAAGIVHRDMKPENLFLTKGADGEPSIKVLDFGISKMAGQERSGFNLTQATQIMGSPYYMSPEQLRSSRDVDARADVWSLGIILYQLLTGRVPFDGENFTELITSVVYGEYEPPTKVRREIPVGLEAVVARCLERDLGRRYPSVGDLAKDLLPFAPGEGARSVERILRRLGQDPAEATFTGLADASGAHARVGAAGANAGGAKANGTIFVAAGLALALGLGGTVLYLLRPAKPPPAPVPTAESPVARAPEPAATAAPAVMPEPLPAAATALPEVTPGSPAAPASAAPTSTAHARPKPSASAHAPSSAPTPTQPRPPSSDPFGSGRQ